MKKTTFLACAAALAMCVTAAASDLTSVLTSIVTSVIGNVTTTESSIVGTWKYSGAECMFESESALATAGGEVAATTVEEKIASVYSKLKLTSVTYTFSSDGTYSTKSGKITSSGTYTFDSDEQAITMKSKLGIKTVAYVTVVGSSMSLTFDADKLMSVLKVATSATSKYNSTMSTINSIVSEYNGMKIGYALTKN